MTVEQPGLNLQALNHHSNAPTAASPSTNVCDKDAGVKLSRISDPVPPAWDQAPNSGSRWPHVTACHTGKSKFSLFERLKKVAIATTLLGYL